MTKTHQQSLIPFDDAARESVAKLNPGSGVFVEIKKARNVKFHRKFFTLLKLAYDLWEPEEKTYKGQPITKSFDRFRKDITILAGHYNAVFCINGEVRLEAKSIAFDQCEEEEFEKVFKGVLDVVWNKILRETNYRTPEDVENTVNQLLAYS